MTKGAHKALNYRENWPYWYRILIILINEDIQDLDYRRYGNSKEDDLLTSYRIEFRNKDNLEIFKEKYKDYLL